jgi:RsiW-degrading membrane proteinase PrsW (M82 family)
MRSAPVSLSPLNVRRQPAYWLFISLLVSCFVLVGLEQVSYLSSYPGAWLLSIVLLAATAIPAAIVVYRLDWFEPEPASMIAVALLWGGVIALAFSGLVNTWALSFLQHVMPAVRVDSWAASLVAPIDEELYKGAGLAIIYLMARSEFDSVMDGLVYGAMIGLGFQVMENVQYFMLAAGESGGGFGPVANMYFLRVVLSGLYSHMLFTGLMGFGFAYFVTQRGRTRARRWGILAACALASWGAHFVWNSPWLDELTNGGVGAFVAAIVIKGLPFLLLLVLLGAFARRREAEAFSRLMALETEGDAVTAEELRVLRKGRLRRKALRSAKRTKGAVARSVLKQLMRAQMNLALFHGKVDSLDHPALAAQRDLVRDLRARLASLE